MPFSSEKYIENWSSCRTWSLILRTLEAISLGGGSWINLSLVPNNWSVITVTLKKNVSTVKYIFLSQQFSQWGSFVASVEWLVFVCTHSLGSQWKATYVKSPWIVQKVMEKSKYCLILLPPHTYYSNSTSPCHVHDHTQFRHSTAWLDHARHRLRGHNDSVRAHMGTHPYSTFWFYIVKWGYTPKTMKDIPLYIKWWIISNNNYVKVINNHRILMPFSKT